MGVRNGEGSMGRGVVEREGRDEVKWGSFCDWGGVGGILGDHLMMLRHSVSVCCFSLKSL